MATETERKFLVDHSKWIQVAKPEGTYYRQGYLVIDSQKTIRVRVSADKAYLTVKGESTGISRTEIECAIPHETGRELLAHFAVAQVEKVRYVIAYAGHDWEIDEFLGANEGLIVAEIELRDEDESFEKPGWVREEVSEDERYFNAYLSLHPYSGWDSGKKI